MRRRLDELQTLIDQTLGEVRRISNALRPSILEDLGLSAALHALCNDLELQMPSIRCRYIVTGEERRLSPTSSWLFFESSRKPSRTSANMPARQLGWMWKYHSERLNSLCRSIMME